MSNSPKSEKLYAIAIRSRIKISDHGKRKRLEEGRKEGSGIDPERKETGEEGEESQRRQLLTAHAAVLH